MTTQAVAQWQNSTTALLADRIPAASNQIDILHALKDGTLGVIFGNRRKLISTCDFGTNVVKFYTHLR